MEEKKYKTSKSTEDYLEAIYLLERSGEPVKSVRIAEMLGFSRPAVNQAMNELSGCGYIVKPAYGKISLTEKGRMLAKDTFLRHTVVKNFLLSIGVGEETAENDSCKIEHIISEETIAALKKIIKYKD